MTRHPIRRNDAADRPGRCPRPSPAGVAPQNRRDIKCLNETIEYLGCRARDKITGNEGIVTSVCFDLYGCVQAALNPGLDNDGKLKDIHWHDVQRLQLLPGERVMPIPAFTARAESPAAYDRGPAEKPAPRS